MAMSLIIMSRRCAFTLAKANRAAPRSCIEAMNKVDGHGHGSKLICNNNNINSNNSPMQQRKKGLQLDFLSISSRFFHSRSVTDMLNKYTRDVELNSDIDKMIDQKTAVDKMIDHKTATKIIAPFTINMEIPGYLSLKRTYKKEEISVHVCKYALDSGKDIVPLNIEICKVGSSLDFTVNAHMHRLEIIHGVMTSKDAITALSPSTEEDPKIKRHFIEYLDIRDINASLINKLRGHKDSILHGTDKDSLDWLQRFKEFIKD